MERIINKVVNEHVNIDKLLVVTFTNAAASEMRERIASRLFKEVELKPYLQNQLRLLSKASITTIDSFCLRVVKDNFFKLDLDPNFRIAENSECELLKVEVLEDLLEEKYESDDESFVNILNKYASNKDDENLKNLILKIYRFTRSCVDPQEWIKEKIGIFENDNEEINSVLSTYINFVLNYAKSEIDNSINELQTLYDDISMSELAGKYIDVIDDDIVGLKDLLTHTKTWDDLYSFINSFEFARATGSKGVPEDLKEEITEVRDAVKGTIKDLKTKYFVVTQDEILEDNNTAFMDISSLCKLVLEFDERLLNEKLDRNILDFSDVAHFALKLLTEDEDVANMYKEQFDEILIDEYQDSNLIQENLLNAVSKNNIFMVGDVKQSIYRFRQARPELFLEKYETYNKTTSDSFEEKITEPQKVLLFKNFRSNNNVINQANFVFKNIMSKNTGDIDYTEEEHLIFGAKCYLNEGEKAELCLIESQIDEDEEIDEELLYETNANIEGKYIANRIKEIVGKVDIYDKKLETYRKAKYKDIAILLRSTVGRRDGFIEELSDAGIPVYADASGNYFENTEVQTVLSMLRIIDNPLQDIPLVAVLRSQMGGFSIDELSTIRLCDRNVSFYESMIKSLNLENDLSKKVNDFLVRLYDLREKSKYLSLWELIWDIYNKTGYYYYVSLFPDGVKRVANLNLLLERAEKYEKTSFKGLFNFLNYIDNIKSSTSDYGDSKIIGENEDVVRIMSVHKSKGLEFPIIFLSGVDKSFNFRDYSEDVILDQDLGFGLDIIDYDARIKYSNISKHAITIKGKKDSKSEEMRILYVALTRAREKLIVTGVVKDAEKAKRKYTGKLTNYKIAKSNSFLDWLGYAIVDKARDIWDVKYISRSELYENNDEQTVDDSQIDSQEVKDENWIKSVKENIDGQMNWEYKHIVSTTLPNKVSISEIKRRNLEAENNYDLTFDYNTNIQTKPLFLEDEQDSGTNFGSLVHEVLQKINFKEYSTDALHNIINSFIDDKKIQKSIYNKIDAFSRSDLFNSLKNAKKIFKETAFNLNIDASEVYKVDTDEKVMIQGIIDLYYINQDDELILVDYKTDNVDTEEELVKRYKIQLQLYKRALEEILDKKVAKSIIYSLKFQKEIEVNN